MRKVVLITGPQAVGKSTIGRLLARRLDPPSVSFDGDVLYRMVEVGNVDWTPESWRPRPSVRSGCVIAPEPSWPGSTPTTGSTSS